MQFDISNLISVFIGGLLVFAGQWFASKQSAKIEAQKWKQEGLREARRDIVKFREERAKPVFEALDRIARSWDFDSYAELADAIGYKGEKVEPSEKLQRRQKERKQERFSQLQADISSASRIHDPELRDAVTKLLWVSADPNAILPKGTPSLQDISNRLENWIFNPKIDHGLREEHRKRDFATNTETPG